jgi:UDP-glucose 4-epimerase
MTVLVTGGAGYIGSLMVKRLRGAGRRVVVLDNLSTGQRQNVPADVEFVQGDIADSEQVAQILRKFSAGAVLHFAAHSIVSESVSDPMKYYANNVGGSIGLLRGMRAAGVERLVFSSTAAVYGEPLRVPVDEAHPKAPINPYGATKLAIERLLEDLHAAHGLRSVSLRYFNAAGADPQGELGERRDPPTHLLPLVLQAASGRRDSVAVFGTDYPTRDGTCVRDYIHVDDLCTAHLNALDWLEAGGGREAINLGTGNGVTVLEIVDAVRRETGKAFKVKTAGRRPGDPAALVASCERARQVLGWTAQRSDIASIVRDAWNFEQRR